MSMLDWAGIALLTVVSLWFRDRGRLGEALARVRRLEAELERRKAGG